MVKRATLSGTVGNELAHGFAATSLPLIWLAWPATTLARILAETSTRRLRGDGRPESTCTISLLRLADYLLRSAAVSMSEFALVAKLALSLEKEFALFHHG